MTLDAQRAYALLYLEINLASVLLMGIIRWRTEGHSQMVAQRNFVSAFRAQTAFFLSDTFHMMMECGVLPISRPAVLLAKTVYFFSSTLMCFFWFVYFEYLHDSPFVRNRKQVLLSSSMVWVIAALLLANLSGGFLFSVDAAGDYTRGPLFLLQYLLSYVYVFFASCRAMAASFQRKRYAQRQTLRALALFPLAPAAAGVLQFFYPQLPIACVALSLATLVLYLKWMDQMISVDPLTKLNNRKHLVYHYEQWMQGSGDPPLYLLLIDANKFKGINDTYGHTQGDAALVRIADALRIGCKGLSHRANIARYGGDEFVILVFTEDPTEIERLRERIDRTLAELNAAANAPYELTVSIGAAPADPNVPLKEMIERADVRLYEEKARRHAGQK